MTRAELVEYYRVLAEQARSDLRISRLVAAESARVLEHAAEGRTSLRRLAYLAAACYADMGELHGTAVRLQSFKIRAQASARGQAAPDTLTGWPDLYALAYKLAGTRQRKAARRAGARRSA